MKNENSKKSSVIGAMSSVALYFLLLASEVMTGALMDDVSYKDVQELGVSCYPLDSCEKDRRQDRLDSYNCNCDRNCDTWNTCCVDSPFRNTARNLSGNNIPNCHKIYGKFDYIFMVDRCSPQWAGDREIETSCLDDGERSNDPLLTVPVTNPQTGITYKNYFCYLCNGNDDSEMPIFWNLMLGSESETFSAILSPEINYNETLQSWIAVDSEENGQFAPVSLSVEVPETLRPELRWCRDGVISNCSPLWNDNVIEQKCKAYMAMIFVANNGTNAVYRNVHCAICNYEALEGMECSEIFTARAPNKFPKFLRIFDLNSKKEGRKCEKPAMYDPLGKKCRVMKCNSTNFVLKKGKCVKVGT